MSEQAVALRRQFAREDMVDVRSCSVFVAFTEEPRSGVAGGSRGGRRVGYRAAVDSMPVRESPLCR